MNSKLGNLIMLNTEEKDPTKSFIYFCQGNPFAFDVHMKIPEITRTDEVTPQFGFDPYMLGYPFGKVPKGLRLTGTSKTKNLKKLKHFYPYVAGGYISNSLKELFTKFYDIKADFVPADIYYEKDNSLLCEYWYMNVYEWCDLIDLEKSDVEWYDYNPLSHLNPDQVEAMNDERKEAMALHLLQTHRFGTRAFGQYRSLILKHGLERDIFFIKVPSDNIYTRPIISQRLIEHIRSEFGVNGMDYDIKKLFLNNDNSPTSMNHLYPNAAVYYGGY
jgi:hypothetical protein